MKDINLFKTNDSIFLKKINSKRELKDGQHDGYLIESSEKEARRIIDSLTKKKKIIGFVGGEDALNRRVVEKLKINYLFSPERGYKKNTLKQRDSGLNHVVAKEAKRRGIKIIIDFSEILNLKGKEKALRIEGLIQNIKVCRKAGCKIGIVSLADSNKGMIDAIGRRSFGTSLGMSSQQSKESVNF